MIDINQVIEKAKKKAIELEKLPRLPEITTSESAPLKTYKYPAERNLDEYLNRFPDLTDLLSLNKNILDIGTGEGLALSQIRDQHQCCVVGTGITTINNRWNIPFYVAEASQLPFKDDHFDLAISVHGISWAPDQKKAIDEAIRVVKPGKCCLIELIKFSSSVDLWYGDEFWDDLNVTKWEFMSEYDFSPEFQYENAELEITPIHVPEKQYKIKYYIKCRKKK